MPSLGDLLRDRHQGAQAVARGDWDCALRLFASVPEPSARMSFTVGSAHLLVGDPEAALRVIIMWPTGFLDPLLGIPVCDAGVTGLQAPAVRRHLRPQAFDQAVTEDACLAVGVPQCRVANSQLERFQEALSDFQHTLAQLRGNTAIDYNQLGLRFKLQA